MWETWGKKGWNSWKIVQENDSSHRQSELVEKGEKKAPKAVDRGENKGQKKCRKMGGAAAVASYVLREEQCCMEAKLFIICNLAGTPGVQK